MDGWEVFNRLKAITCLRNVPIVFISSLSATSEKSHAHKIGAADFIEKPFAPEDLLNRIKKVINK
jgi:DNA-binding response OmpR family regulator